ncbi:MAG TPA: hypothetical protein VMG13_03150 [Trebonia sp.]|nr:hypothetical protein [Trebonia sp.]
MVIEANFHPHSEHEMDKLRGLGDRVAEVHCACLPRSRSPATAPGAGRSHGQWHCRVRLPR